MKLRLRRLTAGFTVSLTAGIMVLAGCSQMSVEPVPTTQIDYPPTRMSNTIDMYHGVQVADPYRWLEQMDSPEVQEWIRNQNQFSNPYLQELPTRELFKQRLTSLWNYERMSTPFRKGSRYFFYRNDGLQNQSVLYVSEDLNRPARVLIDPNQFSTDGTVALSRIYLSSKANYVAYGVSDGGSDWVNFKVRSVNTGEDLDTFISGTKFTNLAWLPDESGFFYSRYPTNQDGRADDQQPVQIYFHLLGTPQERDILVYSVDDERPINPYPQLSNDGRFLIANLWEGYFSNAVHVLNRSIEGAQWQPLFDDWDALYNVIATDGNIFYVSTTNEAPTGRVIAVDINRPEPQHWQEIIPAKETTLDSVSYVGGRFFANYLKDAQSHVEVYSAHGRHIRTLDLPGIGSVQGFTGDPEHMETFFTLTTFTQPGNIYHYDIATGRTKLHYSSDINTDLTGYVTEQVFYTSKDGTQVPMFIVRHRDTLLDSSNPVLLYGYGGFGVSLTPSFSIARTAWLEQGGIVAIPNLRGGGEYGDAWHRAGTKLNKQNVFDDFIAAAEYLIDQGYTQPSKLAIQGGSNGGLLVAAAMLQRPELFAVALPAVGVLDMLRYHTPSANARAWSSDFGLSENPEEFAALFAYSPIHNTQRGVCYPATLITTGDHDDRVVPWHSYKFAAVLQRDQGCDNPVLLRVETRAGHGAGTPTWMAIEQIADQWAFMHKYLGMDKAEKE